MLPETEEQKLAREADLKRRRERLGLVVAGSFVVAPLGNPVVVDASAIDHKQLVAGLMYLSFKSGEETGRNAARAEMLRLLGDSE